MDQGVAAVIAAVVALVGAVAGAAVGGITAARGARIGAETTARATVEQVRDQAAMDHEHWLRGQRLEACTALLAAYDEYAIVASNMTRAVEGEVTGSAELGLAFGQSVTDFRKSFFQVRLVGPPDVCERAMELRRGLEDHKECVEQWTDAFVDMDGCTAAAAQAEEERLRYRLGDLHDEFVAAATHSATRSPAAE
ncbi:hypothetical protein [Streptomyces sp. ODS28]|uniref:hypothetical protein n=1 Tax=Streptomyces sp. ODS28 TaxID=3136688 RepID=UPI0031EC2F78